MPICDSQSTKGLRRESQINRLFILHPPDNYLKFERNFTNGVFNGLELYDTLVKQ